DLVVARACRVQPPGGRAGDLDQSRLDVHMDVLELRTETEGAGLDLLADLPQTGFDRRAVLGGDDAALRQHRRVRERAFDVLAVEALVDIDRNVYARHYI